MEHGSAWFRQNTFANVVEEIFQNVLVEARQTSQFKFCLFKFTELTELSLPSIHIYIYTRLAKEHSTLMPTLKCKASYKWISIYGPGRRPATPPWCPPPATTGPPPWGWPSHLRPSVKISCAILTCWPRATYTLITSNYQTGYLHAVFTTAYMCPYNLFTTYYCP